MKELAPEKSAEWIFDMIFDNIIYIIYIYIMYIHNLCNIYDR